MALKKSEFSNDEIPIFEDEFVYKRVEYWQMRMWLVKEKIITNKIRHLTLVKLLLLKKYALALFSAFIILCVGSKNVAAQELPNPLHVIEYSKMFKDSKIAGKLKIAFIDLSDLRAGPQVVIANLNGEVLRRIVVPADRFNKSWTNWGPGITVNTRKNSLWVLFPNVGLTEFDLSTGKQIGKLEVPLVSHQIQITKDETFVMPFSWDKPDDAQLVEVAKDGGVIFEWRADNRLNNISHMEVPAYGQPPSYTATTSAKKLANGNYVIAMAQKGLILEIDKSKNIVKSQNVSTRPHTLVTSGSEIIGYSARSPNRIIIKNKACGCFKEIPIEEQLGGKASARTLSLENIDDGLWFVSGVLHLYIISETGEILWKLSHDGLKGRPVGFHSAVTFMD
jgi:hypothetical protein